MALQTETSTTPTSTSTTSTASSPASTTPLSSGASFFNPNSSTPLVLSFLGVGLIAAGFILFMGWRRTQLARLWTQEFEERRRTQLRDAVESPKLWDLWTNTGKAGAGIGSEVKSGQRVGMDAPHAIASASGDSSIVVAQSTATVDHVEWAKEMAWASVMPISATPCIRESDKRDLVTDETNTHPSPTTTVSILSRLNTFRNRAMGELISLIHLYRRHPLQIQADAIARRGGDITAIIPPNVRARTETEGVPLKERRNESNLEERLRGYEGFQVLMAIAMPQPKQKPREGDEGAMEAEMYEYSIGVCRVTWDGSIMDSSEVMNGISTDTTDG